METNSAPQARVSRLLAHLGASQPADGASSSPSSSTLPQGFRKPLARPSLSWVGIEVQNRVAVLTLQRPKVNALCDELIRQLCAALDYAEANPDVGCIVLTGTGKAFSAGADISEMKDMTFMEMSTFDKIKPWERISRTRLPLIAAVNGVALGGGCEIAMMCDIIIASESARFGQPEISIGTIPGAAGTQRLTRAVGKSKAMELILAGTMMSAAEALQFGLVSRVVAPGVLLPTARALAESIAAKSRPVAIFAKEAVNVAYNTTLDEGIHAERRLFHSTFALEDRKEGMDAFAERRSPKWKHK